MAHFHVDLKYVQKGQVAGGARGYHRYLQREGLEHGQQYHRYITRDEELHQGRDDLVACGHAHLPAWAQNDPEHFWQMADKLERKRGPEFYQLTVTLPRELSPQGRRELADDIRAMAVERYPHSWAIHEPAARDGSINPHLHVQFSTRREDVERGLSPERWFMQPNHGGVAKDQSWYPKERLLDLRRGVELLSNAALEREGLGLAVSAQSLKARGIDRAPSHYWGGKDKEQVLERRAHLHERTDLERVWTYAGWVDHRHALLSVDRQHVLDLARDHLWRSDRSPARVLERERSQERTLELAMREREPTRTLERTRAPRQERTYERPTGRDLAHDLARLTAAIERLDDAPVGGGVQVRLWDKDRERDQGLDRGLGW